MSSISVVLLLVGLVVGAAAVFFALRTKGAAEEAIWREQNSKLEQERNALQSRLNDVLPLEGEAKQLRETLNRLDTEASEATASREAEREKRAVLETELEASRREIAEKELAIQRERERFLQEKKQLEDSFQSLSKQALDSAQESFLKMANQKFADERKVGQTEIDKVLEPVRITLEQLQQHTREIEKERTSAYAELTQQVRSLLGSTTQLGNALRRPEFRGSWGEMTLRRAAEHSGLVEGTDFEMQVHIQTDDARLRPDMIVKLSNDRVIVVDAKTPLDAYLQAQTTDDETQRQILLKAHTGQVRSKIKELSTKAYQGQWADTADFVVMFVPSEAIYQVAIQEDPDLLEEAFNKRVILANPMTLVALLKTIANGMRQQKAYENSLQIAKLGGELHDAVATFAGHYTKLGASLNTAVNRFNDSVGSLERTVLPKTRRLTELGSKATKELEAIDHLDVSPRTPSLPEVVSPSEDSSSLF